ncbi:hypothetical protein [Butyrivibrio sp. AC2005]|uniref:hypothetical protein n=1 Tax=Butyrivibrio sp. AC2005 TaxID=1280672 RepID=UPI000401FA01|nr:hypothetical protein [Butyrivibrio sp. AC2005]
MGLYGDDSFSYEKRSFGERNFFAIRKVYEVSFDGITWFKAGDHVHYVSEKYGMLRSKVINVEYDGSILVENKKGIFSCSAKEMEFGRIAFGRAADCKHRGCLAVRYREQFTIDLNKWYTVGQSYIIKTDRQLFVGAEITGVMNNGNIRISCDGSDDVIYYSEILDIFDYCKNYRYLLLGKKTEKEMAEPNKKYTENAIVDYL